MNKHVLTLSHSGIIEGTKQIQRVETQRGKNPSGVAIHRRLKEKALKDVTNNLETGPVNLKPTWNRLRLGTGSGVKENAISKNKAHVSKAHLVMGEILSKAGSGLAVGLHATCPSDPLIVVKREEPSISLRSL